MEGDNRNRILRNMRKMKMMVMMMTMMMIYKYTIIITRAVTAIMMCKGNFISIGINNGESNNSINVLYFCVANRR